MSRCEIKQKQMRSTADQMVHARTVGQLGGISGDGFHARSQGHDLDAMRLVS